MNHPAPLAGELRWLLNAAPLLRLPDHCEDGGTLLRQAALAQPALIQTAAEALARQPRRKRLGWHFENLVAALIQHSDRFDLVARNLVLRENGRTLGELDLLVRERASGELMHWELALKFYLGLGEGRGWPGPNPHDQLASKARHLYDVQLPRAAQPGAMAQLQAAGHVIHRRALLTRGRLFYPCFTPCPAPPQADPAHQRGPWWREPPGAGQVVPHDLWHHPEALSDNPTPMLAAAALADYVSRVGTPTMILTTGQQPGFLVPPSWPERNRPE